MIAPWLRRVERSVHAHRLVVRGSLVTRRFFPTRIAQDVDHLALEALDVAELHAMARDVSNEPDAVPLVLESQLTIWADTRFPGSRNVLRSGDEVLQVDIGFGDPLSVPPERATIEGVNVLVASAVSIVAWKIHGLVELGPRGRWRAKDLHDVLLYASLPIDDAKLAAALAVAFSSRGHAFSLLDGFRTDPTWGASASSARKWKSFSKKVKGVPPLAEVIEAVRKRYEPVIKACVGTR